MSQMKSVKLYPDKSVKMFHERNAPWSPSKTAGQFPDRIARVGERSKGPSRKYFIYLDVPRQQCKNVPKTECKNVPRQECKGDKILHVFTVITLHPVFVVRCS